MNPSHARVECLYGETMWTRSMVVLCFVFTSCRCEPSTMTTDSDVRVETTSIDFGNVYVGASKQQPLIISNAGRSPVTVELSVTSPFSLAETSVRLAGGERRELPVTFSPSAVQTFSAKVLISTTEVVLFGNGIAIPDCAQEECATSVFSITEEKCVRTIKADQTACDPGCGAEGLCIAGVCRAQNAGRCDDGNPCTTDACASDGGCTSFPTACPVTAACQVASCDPAVGCIETPVEDGIVCGEPTCAELQICLSGTCQSRAKPNAATDCSYVEVSAHGLSACAKTVSGLTRCWGANSRDELLRGFPTSVVEPAPFEPGFEVHHFTGGRTLCVVSATGRLLCPGRFDGGDEAFAQYSPNGACGVLRDGGLFGCPFLPDAGRDAVLPAVSVHPGAPGHVCIRPADGGVTCFANVAIDDAGSRLRAWSFDSTPVDIVNDRGVWALMNDGGIEARGLSDGFYDRILPGAHAPWAAFARDTYSQFVTWGVLHDDTIETCTVELVSGATTGRRPCTALPGGLSFARITAGDSFACGLGFDGGVWCWGNNQYGQLGEPIIAQSPRTIASGDIVGRSVFLTCFGDGGCVARQFPEDVLIAAPGPVEDLCSSKIISNGKEWALNAGREFVETGSMVTDQWQPSGGGGTECAFQNLEPDAVAVVGDTSSSEWSCTLRVDGGVDCNGLLNGSGGLHPRDGGNEYAVHEHLTMPAVKSIRGAIHGACGLTSAGRVWCWGYGFGALEPHQQPLSSVRQLECNSAACCGLYGDNGVSCWGDNWNNQLGASGPSSIRPRAIPIDEPVRRLSYGADCALLSSGRAKCWSAAGNESPRFSDAPIRLIK